MLLPRVEFGNWVLRTHAGQLPVLAANRRSFDGCSRPEADIRAVQASGSRRKLWGLLAAAWVGFAAATIYLIGL
jgi:hypothetical protein